MVAYKNRVRGHNYMNGFGDGGAKLSNNDNASHLSNSGSSQLRGSPGIENQKSGIATNMRLHGNKTNPNDIQSSTTAGNRESLLWIDSSQQQKQKQLIFLRHQQKSKGDIAKENWDMYFPNQQLQQQLQLSKTVGTGSNQAYLDEHLYRNPIPQVADMWYFTTYIVFVASIILCGAILLNFCSIPPYTSTTASSISDAKKGSNTISTVTAGGGMGVNGISSNSTKSKYRKFKEKHVLRKPKTDEWNEDDDEDRIGSVPLDIQRESCGGEPAVGLLSASDIVRLEGSVDVNNTYYPYQVIQNHHQHRQRKSAILSSSAATNIATISSAAASINNASLIADSREENINTSETVQVDNLKQNQDGGNSGYANPETEMIGSSRAGVYYLNHSGNIVIGNKKNYYQFHANNTPSLVSSAQTHQSLMIPDHLMTPNYDREIISKSSLDQSFPSYQTPSLIHRSESNDNTSPSRLNPSLSIHFFDSQLPDHTSTSNMTRLHARPLPTTASSFVSLTGNSEFISKSDSLQSFDKGFPEDYAIACTTPQSAVAEQDYDYTYDEVSFEHPNYDDSNDVKAPLLHSRSTRVRHRRREDPATASNMAFTGIGDSGAAPRSRMLSPDGDDIRYLLGIDGTDTADQQGLAKQINVGSHQKMSATNSNRNQVDQRSPKYDRTTSRVALHMHHHQSHNKRSNSTAVDLLEKTPRVTNGRQSIVFDDLLVQNCDEVNGLSNEAHENFGKQGTLLPSLQHERSSFQNVERSYNAQSQSAGLFDVDQNDRSKTLNESASNSECDTSSASLDHSMCYQFASPPNAQRRCLASSANESNIAPSPNDSPAIPFVPDLFRPPFPSKRMPPPKSINIDELHLYQLMETGNVSHWEDRVAEESRILRDQQKPLDVRQRNESTDFYGGSNRPKADNTGDSGKLEDSMFSLRLDEMFQRDSNAGNIRDQVMEAASDAMLSSDSIPSGDPRKSIAHIRKDLTTDTDASASLQGSIDFDDLKLVEVVGGGGFGQVWKAFWLGTPVAVKILTGSAQSKYVPKAILQEFAAEINLLKGMRHPNICLYMGACIAPPNRAIITEFAANGSLWDALRLPLMPPYSPCDGLSREGWPDVLYQPDSRHGAPPILSTPVRLSQPSQTIVPRRGTWHWMLVRHVARGAARGMAYLHSGNPPVLHRDLKSANILLDESYTAKVCDFGLSRLKASESNMTGNCGTVQWMAPEVLSNENYNEKADVYSYGIICWELLTAECPFDGMTPIQCALAVLNRDQRPEIPKWCPPALQALIRSCIKKDPKLRPTFEQIIEKFDAMP